MSKRPCRASGTAPGRDRPPAEGPGLGAARETPMPRPRHLAILLALAAGAALPAAPALAAPAAVTPPDKVPWITVTSPDAWVVAKFTRDGQARWYRVALKQGQDYAVHGYDEDGVASLALYDPSGRQLLSLGLNCSCFEHGAEFRAPVTGTYRVKVVGNRPSRYGGVGLGVSFDCPGGPTTKCILAVGRKPTGWFNFYDEHDWRRVAARAGRSYTVTATAEGEPASGFVVLDRHGAGIASCKSQDDIPCQVRFTATYDGTYYVAANDLSDEAFQGLRYRLTLTSP